MLCTADVTYLSHELPYIDGQSLGPLPKPPIHFSGRTNFRGMVKYTDMDMASYQAYAGLQRMLLIF